MNGFLQILLVSGGGALGALSRFGIAKLSESYLGDKFPWGTLGANLIGCLLIGLLIGSGRSESNESLRLWFGVGFLGALTTFSTFSAETHRHLTSESELWFGVANIGLNLLLGLVAVAVGIAAGRHWLTA